MSAELVIRQIDMANSSREKKLLILYRFHMIQRQNMLK